MKITYLGTSAAEGFPAVFCNCRHCIDARKLGGKNIRTRSQAIINNDLLIDLPADTYSHFLNNGIQGDLIENLLITHSHGDHFYIGELEMRSGAFAKNMRVPVLGIYCGQGVYDKLSEKNYANNEFNKIDVFTPVNVGNYRVTSFPANHFYSDDARFYLIEGEKTILYAHDTGFFYDEVFGYLEENNVKLDLISMDCTNIDIPIEDIHPHMGIENINRLVAKLTDMGVITDKTIRVINHFSHNARPIHHELEQRVKDYGYIVSYDGLTIEI